MSSEGNFTKAQRRKMIYLAAKPFLTQQKTLDDSTTKTLISTHSNAFNNVIRGFGQDSVVKTILTMWQSGAFEGKVKPSAPQLPIISPEVPPAILEQAVPARSTDANPPPKELPFKNQERQSSTIELLGGISGSAEFTKPTQLVQPLFFSYQCQHALLNQTQILLEQSCFEFAHRVIPSVLKANCWTCWEAVELNQWVDILPYYFADIPKDDVRFTSAAKLQSSLSNTKSLRNAAVHRNLIEVSTLISMLRSASKFLEGIRDTQRALKLNRLLERVIVNAKELEVSQERLKANLNQELAYIEEQRAIVSRHDAQVRNKMAEKYQIKVEKLSYDVRRGVKELNNAGVFASLRETASSILPSQVWFIYAYYILGVAP